VNEQARGGLVVATMGAAATTGAAAATEGTKWV